MTTVILASVSGGVLAFGWFAAVVFIGYMVLRWRKMSPFRLSTPGIAFSTYIGLLLIPGLILAPSQQDEEAAVRFVFLLILAGGGMLAGMAVASLLYPARGVDPLEYVRMPMRLPDRPGWQVIITLVLTVVFATSVLRYTYRGTIPFLHMLANLHDFTSIVAARDLIKEVNETVNPLVRIQLYLTSWSELVMMPLIVFITLAMARGMRTRGWSIAFWLSVCGAMFLGMWEGDRSSGARMAATLLGGALLIRNRLSWKLLALGAGALALPLVIAIAMHPKDMEQSKITDAMADRAFVAPAHITYFYVEAFPKVYAHTWGRGTSVLGAWLGREPAHHPRMVAAYVMGTKAGDTYVNCGFIGTGWAEAGVMGVLILSLAAGGMAQTIFNHILRQSVNGKRVSWVMFQAVQTPLWTVVLASSGLPEFFLGRGLLFSFALAWWLDRRWYSPVASESFQGYEGWEPPAAPPTNPMEPARVWRTPVPMQRGPGRL